MDYFVILWSNLVVYKPSSAVRNCHTVNWIFWPPTLCSDDTHTMVKVIHNASKGSETSKRMAVYISTLIFAVSEKAILECAWRNKQLNSAARLNFPRFWSRYLVIHFVGIGSKVKKLTVLRNKLTETHTGTRICPPVSFLMCAMKHTEQTQIKIRTRRGMKTTKTSDFFPVFVAFSVISTGLLMEAEAETGLLLRGMPDCRRGARCRQCDSYALDDLLGRQQTIAQSLHHHQHQHHHHCCCHQKQVD